MHQVLEVVNHSSDLDVSIAAVTCIDHIGTKFGRKHPENLVIATRTVARLPILNNDDDRLKIVSLLCLASLADVLREEFIPLSTQVLPIAISHLERSTNSESSSVELHDAAIAMLGAVLEHIPYILSIFDLNKILRQIQVSACSKLSRSAKESRRLIYRLMIENVEDGPLFASIENSSKGAIMAGYTVSHFCDERQISFVNLA